MRDFNPGDEVEVLTHAGKWVRGVIAGTQESERGMTGALVRVRGGSAATLGFETLWRSIKGGQLRHVCVLELMAEDE